MASESSKVEREPPNDARHVLESIVAELKAKCDLDERGEEILVAADTLLAESSTKRYEELRSMAATWGVSRRKTGKERGKR